MAHHGMLMQTSINSRPVVIGTHSCCISRQSTSPSCLRSLFIGCAPGQVYRFAMAEFCEVYIEWSKLALSGQTSPEDAAASTYRKRFHVNELCRAMVVSGQTCS